MRRARAHQAVRLPVELAQHVHRGPRAHLVHRREAPHSGVRPVALDNLVQDLHRVVPVLLVDELHRMVPVSTGVDDPVPPLVLPVIEGADGRKGPCGVVHLLLRRPLDVHRLARVVEAVLRAHPRVHVEQRPQTVLAAQLEGAVEFLQRAIVAAHAVLHSVVDAVWREHPIADWNADVGRAGSLDLGNVVLGQPSGPVTPQLLVGLVRAEGVAEALLVHACLLLDRLDARAVGLVGAEELVEQAWRDPRLEHQPAAQARSRDLPAVPDIIVGRNVIAARVVVGSCRELPRGVASCGVLALQLVQARHLGRRRRDMRRYQ
mmetsp:Transcript_18874/g.38431  ORF Transcript_18874/g.38431 Transcript_18874/m.38431 type:complete len:319 (+) Transcript_18874:1098-2054(+)